VPNAHPSKFVDPIRLVSRLNAVGRAYLSTLQIAYAARVAGATQRPRRRSAGLEKRPFDLALVYSLIAGQSQCKRPYRWSGEQDDRQHRDPSDQPGCQPIPKEIVCRKRRKTSDAGSDQAGQSGLYDSKNEMGVPTRNAQHETIL
jgi:hypothetical protein